jgi:hypothetical protein
MAAVSDVLTDRGLTSQVVIPDAIAALIGSLTITAPDPAPATGEVSGTVKLGAAQNLLGFASIAVGPFGPDMAFALKTGPSWFRLDVTLDGHLTLPGLVAASHTVTGDKETLTTIPGAPVKLLGALALRIEGDANSPAAMRLVVPGSATVPAVEHAAARRISHSGRLRPDPPGGA